MTMHFPSGALAHVELIRHNSFGYDQRLEVFGSEGMLQSENQTPLGTRLWNRYCTRVTMQFTVSMHLFERSYACNSLSPGKESLY